METPFVLLIALLTLLAGGAAGYAIAHARSQAARALLLANLAAATARAERLEQEAASLRHRTEEDHNVMVALAPVQATLEAMGRKVEELERQRLTQHNELSHRLTEARTTQRDLEEATRALAGALRTSSARGVWGEVELRRLLEAAGMLRHVSFTEQTATASGARPDVVVKLPGGRSIPIDAKVPLDSFLAAAAIEEATADALARKQQLLTGHARAMRGHIDALAKRSYHNDLDAEITVLFIPSEALLAGALDTDPGLLEYALSRGIAPTSPASLLALLRAVAAVWAREEVHEQAEELRKLGQTLYERLGVAAKRMDTLGTSLKRTVNDYNAAVASIEARLLVTARQFAPLSGNLPAVAEIDTDAGQVRTFSSPELAD